MPALDDAAGRELVANVRALFAAGIDIQGIQIVLKNGQSSPAPIGTVTLPTASQGAPGVMSAADKVKLDGVAKGATKVTVDESLSATSTNPVQNKAVNSALLGKAPLASPALTGTPTAPTAAAGTSTSQLATCSFVQSAISSKMTGAAMYKGSASKESDISGTAYKAGWYWVVGTAGTYFGEACEAGDMVFCNSDKGASASSSDFDIVQSNVTYVTAADVRSWFS